MCGIFGYVGKRDPLQVCWAGLKQLEYRGYDSTGIVGRAEGKLVFCKKAGKLSALKQTLNLPPLDLAIAHTRWATHGAVTDTNAHPHFDAGQTLALVHNGIIENYAELKASLIAEGVPFVSDTDSEVVANLVAKYYKGDLVQAFNQALLQIRGSFAFLLIHKDHPEEIIAVAKECPLSIGWDDAHSEVVISSDPNAFQGAGFNILFLREGEVARIKRSMVNIYDLNLNQVIKKMERLDNDVKPPSKEGFEHYMLKEIYEQPATVKKAMLGRFDQSSVFFEEWKIEKAFLKEVDKIWFLGCGTSAHAGLLTTLLLEDLARLPASIEIASEARYRHPLISPKTLIVAISQSGETADTLAAMRETKKRGCTTLGICNVKNSTLVREADATLLLKAGPEMSVCSTKAFTSQLTVLTLLTLYFSALRGKLSSEKISSLLQELEKIPEKIQTVIDHAEAIRKCALKYAQYDDFFFMGRRYMYPTAMEAALKLKEISYVNANGYPAGELKHGPIALLDSRFPVVAFCANEQTREKMGSSLAEVRARGAPTLAIVPESYTEFKHLADDLIWVPDTIDELASFPSTVAGQLFAYFVAKARGCDIDQPRNLAKSVTVE